MTNEVSFFRDSARLSLAILFAVGVATAGESTSTLHWGDASFSAYSFNDGDFDGFGDETGTEFTGLASSIDHGSIGDHAGSVNYLWLNITIDSIIPAPDGNGAFDINDLTSVTLDFPLYRTTLDTTSGGFGTLHVYHIASSLTPPNGVLEYNDDPTLHDAPASGSVQGYSTIGTFTDSNNATFASLEDQGAGLNPTQAQVDLATANINLDVGTAQTEFGGDQTLSLLLGSAENPYDSFYRPVDAMGMDKNSGASNRDIWEWAGGTASGTYTDLGAGNNMRIDFTFNNVPEPTVSFLMAIGCVIVGLRRRRPSAIDESGFSRR